MMKGYQSRAGRLFRWLLRLFPFDFRWEHGREMEQDFRTRRRAEERNGGGTMGMLKLWWETISDIARTAPREHLDMLRQDVSYALRTMRKNPGFTAVAVLTLALGIGANTAMFTVINTVLLQPLPYQEPDRLVFLRGAPASSEMPTTPGNFLDWRGQFPSLEKIAAYDLTSGGLNLSAGGTSIRVTATEVSTNLFGMLGILPVAGQLFHPEHMQPGNTRVVVISHRLWQRRFGGDHSLIGKTIQLNEVPHTVLGVLPPGLRFPTRHDVWVPMVFGQDNIFQRVAVVYAYLGRMKSGVSLEMVRAESAAYVTNLKESAGAGQQRNMNITASLLQDTIVHRIRPVLWLLFGAVNFIFLISCANLANLLLARGAGREKELAIRAAMGAGRSRLLRQLLTENLLLAVTGGLAGLLAAAWLVNPLVSLAPGILPAIREVRLDPSVLAFTLGLSFLSALLAGALPALRAFRTRLLQTLQANSQKTGAIRPHRLTSSLLVVSQIALALVLLAGGGLLLRSFLALRGVDPGFDRENILTLRVSLPRARYPTAQHRRTFYQSALEQLRALPGVRQAGAVNFLPLGTNVGVGFLLDIPQAAGLPARERMATYVVVTPGYFEVMGTTLRQGRDFTKEDGKDSSKVVLVNQFLANRFWPGRSAVGEELRMIVDNKPSRIIGVVGNVRRYALEEGTQSEVYLPYTQAGFALSTIVLKTSTDPAGLIEPLRKVIGKLDANLPVYNIRTMEQFAAGALARQRFQMIFFCCFALLALLLALGGVYAALSYAVSQRTREIGVRLALGAQPGQILRMILREGMLLTALGAAAGLLAALGLTRYLESLLFGVTSLDPATLAAVPLILSGTAFLACYIPARRAMKVDPMVALRYE